MSRADARPPGAAAVIPARYASSRFPAKVLADLQGRPVIRWVHDACVAAGVFRKVIVAADHEEVRRAAEGFGARVVMTDPRHGSGTERVAEVAAGLTEEIVVNVQGDEPFVDDTVLKPLVERMRAPGVEVGTPVTAVASGEELASPDVVKVLLDHRSDAICFSRWPIPFHREAWGGKDPWRAVSPGWDGAARWWRHLGIYAFRRERLIELVKLPPSPAEELEKLEQLRWLHFGVKVACVPVSWRGVSIDTPGDLERARALAGSRRSPAGGEGSGRP